MFHLANNVFEFCLFLRVALLTIMFNYKINRLFETSNPCSRKLGKQQLARLFNHTEVYRKLDIELSIIYNQKCIFKFIVERLAAKSLKEPMRHTGG